jgi:hypothetical protein
MKLDRSACAAAALALVLLSTGVGCGNDDPPVTAAFGGSGVTAAANVVRLTGQASSDTVVVGVAIGGPTTSGDLYSFAFDVTVGDPSAVQYVEGSATIGSALTLGTGQTGEALASQSGSVVTVGVTKLGGGAGNGVGAGESGIVNLTFRVLKATTTTIGIAASATALDSNGAAVPSVQFDSTPATIAGF